MEPSPVVEKTFSRSLLDVLIRAGLIAVLVIFASRYSARFGI